MPTKSYKNKVLSALQSLYKEPFEIGGETLYVRELTGAEWVEYQELMKKEAGIDAAVWGVSKAIVDEDGKQVFTLKDAEELKKASPRIMRQLAEKILEVSGLVESEPSLAQGQSDGSSSD